MQQVVSGAIHQQLPQPSALYTFTAPHLKQMLQPSSTVAAVAVHFFRRVTGATDRGMSMAREMPTSRTGQHGALRARKCVRSWPSSAMAYRMLGQCLEC